MLPRTALPDSGASRPYLASHYPSLPPRLESLPTTDQPPALASPLVLGSLPFYVCHERRRTGRRRTVDHVANRPPNVRHLFDGPEELRTGRPRQRARREPNVPVRLTKGTRKRQTGVDEVDGHPLPADKAVRAGEPNLPPVPRNHAHRCYRVGGKLAVVQVEQDDVRREFGGRDAISRYRRRGASDQGRPGRREVGLDRFGQRDIIKCRRRAKGYSQPCWSVSAQKAKCRLPGLDRNGIFCFHIRERSRCRWGAGRSWYAAAARRHGGAIVVQEIRSKQLVIRDRGKLAVGYSTTSSSRTRHAVER